MNWEQKTLINELTQGMEMARQLKVQLRESPSSSIENGELLVQKILSSYDKALLILNWSGGAGAVVGLGQQSQPVPPASGGVQVSPAASLEGSPRSEVFDKGLKDQQQQQLSPSDVSKKRKLMPKWTDQVRVSSENGLEGPNEDGYSWRKYGQKDILGSKYPRSYYRCTYRNIKDCWATKQVQRSDDNPTIFEITYRGRHKCMQGNLSNPQTGTPEKQEPEQNNHQNSYNQYQSNEILCSFRNGLRVNTDDLDNKEMASPLEFSLTSSVIGMMKSENHIFSPATLNNNNPFHSFSQSFISPATSESNYFSVSPCQMSNFGGVQTGQCSESDFTEILSANTSTTNSPILDLDFSLEPVDFDPNFPFDNPNFFP